MGGLEAPITGTYLRAKNRTWRPSNRPTDGSVNHLTVTLIAKRWELKIQNIIADCYGGRSDVTFTGAGTACSYDLV
jgi:hypothetical protein